jgi:hypothetical protein
MSHEARQVISAYYRRQRLLGMRATSRTTIRMLESLVRLAQAHARLMSRNVVAMIDAIVVVLLVEASMAGAAIQDFVSPVRTVFHSDPDELFRSQLVPEMLQRLELGQLMDVPLQAPPSQAPPTQRGDGGATQRPPSTFDIFAEVLDDDELSSDDAAPPVVPISIDEPAVVAPPPPTNDDVEANADDNDEDDNDDDGELSAHSQLRRAANNHADDNNNNNNVSAVANAMMIDDALPPPPPPPPPVQQATLVSSALGDALARVRAASSLISHSNPNSQAGDGSSRGSSGVRRKRLLNDENDKQ